MKRLRNYLVLITVLYSIWIIFDDGGKYIYMVWNIVLAWIPFELSALLYSMERNQKGFKKASIIAVAIWILWILFYPNAPYMITDFIHISTSKFYLPNPSYVPHGSEPSILFNDNFRIWLSFVDIGIGVWIGYMLGVMSLYMNQELIRERFGKWKAWAFVIAVNILSGFAMFLGRFARWNSWDVIVHPINIVFILINNINSKALYFTVLFATLNFIIYLIFYIAVKMLNSRE